MHIQYFGTGAAINANIDTTHFVISDGNKKLYVDAGGGMSLGQRVLRGEIEIPQYLFMTHCHIDHLMGLPFMIRIVGNSSMTLIITDNLAKKVHDLMYIVGKGPWYDKKIESGNIKFIYINKGENIDIYDRKISPINLHSKKVEQFGFSLSTGSKHIVFFGDEAVDVMERNDLERFMGCDRLLCEAFCADKYKDEVDPYGKAHITSVDAGNIARKLEAKNLVLSHITEDINLNRKLQIEEMKTDAESSYSGNVIVPMDGDIIDL